jgi:hypothetical protein
MIAYVSLAGGALAFPHTDRLGATNAAPIVWPSNRSVPGMPLAPSLRSRGAAAIIVRLLGD